MRGFIDIVTEASRMVDPAALPDRLYHATFAPYLGSIRSYGLGGRRGKRNYDCSEDGVIYLATSPEVAFSYAEVSEEVPDEFLNMIVVLAIPTASLDPELLTIDRNVRLDEPEANQTVEYHGVIRSFTVI